MDNETTLEQRLKAERATKDAMMYERMVETFMRQWAPEDHYERSVFESQLTGIVRQTMLDVQRQAYADVTAAARLMHDAMSLMPLPSRKPEVGEHDKTPDVTLEG